jgi:A/G-specific adenine glycosylase
MVSCQARSQATADLRTSVSKNDAFSSALLKWFDQHGRKTLPWQHPRSPYRVWLSEVMLQQTQVRTVIPYFERFVAALPTLQSLAAAPLDRVLALWSGLGYYSRARNLHRCAQICVAEYGAELPRDIEQLSALPGIGRSTAAAILAQAYGDAHAILDGNVRRVLARYHGVQGWPGSSDVQRTLWRYAETHTPTDRVADYTQAIMDLGAMVCTRSRPLCADCPIAETCVALREGLVSQLPQPKPTRATPTRTTAMMIVRDANGRVLLERRPPTGVWARLWSLPECASAEAASTDLEARYAVHARTNGTFSPFVHVFSHYRLEITPISLSVTGMSESINDAPDLGWFSKAELADLGLPSPVRKLLENQLED